MLEILVVDDDRRYARVAVECLTRDHNAAVTVVEDGDEAIRFLSREAYHPHLVLLEMRNRGVTGLHILRKIRRQKPKLPVVVWGTSRNTEEILQAYAEGANMYAEKPSDLAHFRTTIHNIAQLWITPFSSVKAACAR